MAENQRKSGVINYDVIKTPLGDMIVAEHGNRICRLDFAGSKKPESILKNLARHYNAETGRTKTKTLKEVEKQLNLYFQGKLKSFDLPLDLVGTDFQRSVWKKLSGIPFGRTVNYGWIAEKTGNPKAARAVGASIGKNPIAVVVPCHRVIGKNGELTGFAGGLWRKKKLLALESN